MEVGVPRQLMKRAKIWNIVAEDVRRDKDLRRRRRSSCSRPFERPSGSPVGCLNTDAMAAWGIPFAAEELRHKRPTRRLALFVSD
jgi:hypothetical protein